MVLYVVIGALAAFGLMCVMWIGSGLFLPRICAGAAVLAGPLDREAMDTARRWIWLREMGLLYSPLLAVKGTLTEVEENWLYCHGFEICSREEVLSRLGIGENEFD